MFWFHPCVVDWCAIWMNINARDEDVINRGNHPGIYEAISPSVSSTESPLVCVSGVTGSDLRRRIEAIMRNRRVAGLSLGKKLALGMTGLLAFTVPIAMGVLNAVWAQEMTDWQTKAGGKMAFEVASVKLNKAEQMVPLNVPLDAGDQYLRLGPFGLTSRCGATFNLRINSGGPQKTSRRRSRVCRSGLRPSATPLTRGRQEIRRRISTA
jgi:hypothetical protein